MDNERFAPQASTVSSTSTRSTQIGQADTHVVPQPQFAPITPPSGDDRFAPGSPTLTAESGDGHLRPSAPPGSQQGEGPQLLDLEPLEFPDTQLVDPTRVFATAGYQAPQIKQHLLTMPALICSLLVFIPGIPLIGGCLAGFVLWRMQRKRYANHGTVVTALILSVVVSLGQLFISLISAPLFGL